MSSMPARPAAAFLSRRALRSNLETVRKQIRSQTSLHRADAKVMAIVKADAYGHSLDKILPELERAKVKDFAVASLLEGIEARVLSKRARILVLGGTFDWTSRTLELLRKYKLEVAVSDLMALEQLIRAKNIPFHLKLDTGMNRLGVRPEEWGSAVQLLRAAKRKPDGIFTHYATNQDAIFHRQAMLFEEAVRWFWSAGCEARWVHSENSGALFGKNQIRKGLVSQVANLVRPGIGLYGYAPRGMAKIPSLTPVLELVSEIGLVKIAEKGEGISYGHLYKAARRHEYGVVPLGYADGISKRYVSALRPQLRSRSGRLKASLEVCGAICMDMVMVRSARTKLQPHDRVVFWGRFPNSILKEGLVEAYELNLRIAKRIPRIWSD